jgi:hypothetical protein
MEEGSWVLDAEAIYAKRRVANREEVEVDYVDDVERKLERKSESLDSKDLAAYVFRPWLEVDSDLDMFRNLSGANE